MSKDKKESPGFDFIGPLVEIIHELAVEVFKGLLELVKFLYGKWNKDYYEIKKIEEKHLKSKKKVVDKKALGFSANQRKALNLSDIDFSKHSFIVGAAGFGKTNLISILQEHSLQSDRPIIFIDPKGDLEALETFRAISEQYKRKCYIFSEHHKDSIKLNPLRDGSVNHVVDRIISAFDWTEPFYKNVSADALSKALKHLQEKRKPFSLASICQVLDESYNNDNTLGLRVMLNQLNDSDFGKILVEDETTKTFIEIREEKACLYVGLSTQGYGETAQALGKLFLGELLYGSYLRLTKSVNSHKSMTESISVFFDEFGAIVTPRFIELQNKCRGAGIQLFMAVQTASDIDKIDPTLTEQIIENSSNLFILKQRLDTGASLFSKAIGTKITKKYTDQVENGEKSGVGTVREVNELLVHPDIIKNLRVGQCILLRHNPTKLDLINIRDRRMEIVPKEPVAEPANEKQKPAAPVVKKHVRQIFGD
jgi:conjugal transfer pilus assembly protein TraD